MREEGYHTKQGLSPNLEAVDISNTFAFFFFFYLLWYLNILL